MPFSTPRVCCCWLQHLPESPRRHPLDVGADRPRAPLQIADSQPASGRHARRPPPRRATTGAEALRLLKIVQRGATKSRTQAANQLRPVVATAPDELRSRLRGLKTPELVAACATFRVRADDDTLAAVTRLTLRELAQRIQLLDDRLARTTARLRRMCTDVAPELVARKGVGPDTASAILISAGDNQHGLCGGS